MDGERPASRRGFAGLSPEKRREISSKGGKAAHEKGTAHEWNKETGRIAGMKGSAKTKLRKKF